jgi:hypothetical protein
MIIYHFPIEAPFCVLFVNAFYAGKSSGFEGSKTILLPLAECQVSPLWNQFHTLRHHENSALVRVLPYNHP